MHYGETVTAQEVWEGWLYHGRRPPPMFATITNGDMLASNIWTYLSCLEQGTAPSIEEFWKAHPSGIPLTRQVLEIYMKDRGQR